MLIAFDVDDDDDYLPFPAFFLMSTTTTTMMLMGDGAIGADVMVTTKKTITRARQTKTTTYLMHIDYPRLMTTTTRMTFC